MGLGRGDAEEEGDGHAGDELDLHAGEWLCLAEAGRTSTIPIQ